jgi:hypothetical protein
MLSLPSHSSSQMGFCTKVHQRANLVACPTFFSIAFKSDSDSNHHHQWHLLPSSAFFFYVPISEIEKTCLLVATVSFRDLDLR